MASYCCTKPTILYEARIHRYGAKLPPRRRTLRLADPVTCRTLLRDAGVQVIEVQNEQLGYYLRTAGELRDEIWYSGQRRFISRLSAENLAQFKAEHLAEVAELATEQGIWLGARVNFARGRNLWTRKCLEKRKGV